MSRSSAKASPETPRAASPGVSLQRVLVVELLQHLVGQADAVQLPERVIVAVVVEVLVVGLEDAPVVRILVRLVAVLAEQNPILVLDEELVRRPRLAAEVVEHGGDVVVHVRVLVEQLAGARQVVARASRSAPG